MVTLYLELLHKNITKDYKKASESDLLNINKQTVNIVKALDLEDRIMKTAEKQAYITMKDHKENFINHPTCRLINPTKPEIGKISKFLLDRINNAVINSTDSNLWRNTTSVLNWYKNICNKQGHNFIVFDVINFYPSITAKLLDKALSFASKYVTITESDKNIIQQAKNSILVSKNEKWCKKSTTTFDVTMGSYDGAETCELVGLYMLNLINTKVTKGNFGLYRDDGLGVVNTSPQETERIKKQLCAIFKEQDLAITIEANKKIVNYLDITLNLTTGEYHPYAKPNNITQYVNKNSNHPPSIIANIPTSINKRLSDIASSKKVFDNSKTQYQNALERSGYQHELTYTPQKPQEKKQSR